MNLSVLIPTHATKREVIGPYSNVDQKNASAPSTTLIEKVISNLEKNLNSFDLNFIIGLDHKVDLDISNDYLNNLRKLESSNLKVQSVDTKHSDRVMTTVTATNNFRSLINNCTTDYFLLWEHDWVFTSEVDNGQLKIENDPSVEMLRFNQHPNTSRKNELVWMDQNRLRTNLYSNNPFICSKNVWYDKFDDYAKQVPTWWGEHGAFIEGPISKHLKELYRENKNEFLDNYKIFLYGNENEQSVINHLNGQIWR